MRWAGQAWHREERTRRISQRSHIAFIRGLEGASRLVARVTPYSSSPVTAIFELRGLGEHVGKLQDACNWN